MRGKRHAHASLDERDSEGRARFDPEDDPRSRPDAVLEEGRRRADIATLVADLPSRYRSALILRYMEGLRLEEVARVLKQPLGTVKSNVHRAVNALREALIRIPPRRRASRGDFMKNSSRRNPTHGIESLAGAARRSAWAARLAAAGSPAARRPLRSLLAARVPGRRGLRRASRAGISMVSRAKSAEEFERKFEASAGVPCRAPLAAAGGGAAR